MPEFVTCLNCMDGRVQKVIIDWLNENYNAKYVDMITEAGMDGYIVKQDGITDELHYKINISVNKHGSKHIFIVGHHDCGGHPVNKIAHHEHIIIAADKIHKSYPDCSVTGVWISDKWLVEKIIDLH